MRLRHAYALFIGRQGWRCGRCRLVLDESTFLITDDWQLGLDGTPQHICRLGPGGKRTDLALLDPGVAEIKGGPWRRRLVRVKLAVARRLFRVVVLVRRHRRRAASNDQEWRALSPPEC